MILNLVLYLVLHLHGNSKYFPEVSEKLVQKCLVENVSVHSDKFSYAIFDKAPVFRGTPQSRKTKYSSYTRFIKLKLFS